ncbi:MAG: tRNA pseudouridine(38-40) synthase TruA [Flavobacteriaceae bacterium]|nr:tRNA pseudouridine(38-40) synthase TruA [Muriicola sp.]MBT8290833.1 tRNA pseudouridine(38-40) synthase TruA [Muriicola sp.]NNK21627.1 tRNA pseudouridine(38-40) synthase TruA [Flavobacteriaceae bacterium]NNK36032.1 tRNA pseudouridine(38-40) synthase TruA [Eudoraea sp.]NNL39333.1 tRNA pseudouridine(38-40) synthase TruA [Flavobacteriaceae bacterium]
MRYFIEFSYNGKAYHGWQRQPKATSIQQTMEEAMSTLLRAEVQLVGAGRTDAGVHARQLFAHFDIDNKLESAELVHRLNAFLPEDIAVREIREVVPKAHARFDALERTYEYRVVLRKDPFSTDWAHYIHLPLDMEAMNLASAELLKHSDFECFSKSNTDVKTYVCRLKEAKWRREGDTLIFTITSDRFLRNMVRAVVGTLLDVGLGKSTVENVNSIIKSKDRGEAGVSVPAKGLYLMKIRYPDTLFQLHG